MGHYARYQVTPSAGIEHLDEAAAKAKGGNYLFEDLTERIARGAVRFEIHVQVAEESDIVDYATTHWPESRRLVPFGTIALTDIVPNSDAEQRHTIFDPIPRVDGIEPSADPLLELRAALYLLSGRRRRQAPVVRTA